jgi:ammonia channel protein AmtB
LNWKKRLEEPYDILIIHGFGGMWGMFATGIFAEYVIPQTARPCL